MEYYSAIKRNECESFELMWMDLQPVIQSKVSQKEKNKYRILTHVYVIQRNGADETIVGKEQRHRCREQTCRHGREMRGWDELREQH